MAEPLLLELVRRFKQQGGRINAALLGKPAVAPGDVSGTSQGNLSRRGQCVRRGFRQPRVDRKLHRAHDECAQVLAEVIAPFAKFGLVGEQF